MDARDKKKGREGKSTAVLAVEGEEEELSVASGGDAGEGLGVAVVVGLEEKERGRRTVMPARVCM